MVLLLCAVSIYTRAQQQVHFHIIDKKSNVPLSFVSISKDNVLLATTDSAGNAMANMAAGSQHLQIRLEGYKVLDTVISITGITTLNLALEPAEQELEEVTVVSSTRSNQAIENSPQKVEVLDQHELSEEASIKPGNIGSILGDVSGVQVQQSSATTGNGNVRIQGLSGRYTQVVQDGMPLYGGFSGGFGIMTIPPLDLKQIELIKGSASTLFGGGAISGLINLISKRPAYEQELDALVNYTTLKEGNANIYAAKRNKYWGYTFFAGYTNQQATDVNKDGFSDVPNINSVTVHPRLFYYPSDKTIISLGYSGTFDNRKGGDMQVLQQGADSQHQYFETDKSQRNTGEYLVEHYFSGNTKLTVKGTASNYDMSRETNLLNEAATQLSYYNEASLYVPLKRNSLVLGIDAVGDNFKTTTPDTARFHSLANFTTGIFAQYSVNLNRHGSVDFGLRGDYHNRYGGFLLPRVAGIYKFDDHWGIRAGFGMGYKVPNPLEPQDTTYDLVQLLPLSSTVKPELSYGYNAEVNYKKQWDNHVSLFINQAFFLTQITNPIVFQTDNAGNILLVNANKPIVTKGFDTYLKLSVKSWDLYAGYTYTDARNTYLPANTFIPLTPRNRWAFVIGKEIAEKWRFGLEGSYIGNQYRYDGTQTPSYFLLAAMVWRNLGKHVSLVLNAENLLDYRMSRVERLYTGSNIDPFFKPIWAPIDGRVINFSVRFKL
jgi:iron complex outermembrane receptor protein/outer membrane receptor for ferrienterochelin and colicins